MKTTLQTIVEHPTTESLIKDKSRFNQSFTVITENFFFDRCQSFRHGNFLLSIGVNRGQVALFSKHTREFIKVKDVKNSKGKLKKILKSLGDKLHLCGDPEFDNFVWEWLSNEDTLKLANIIRE